MTKELFEESSIPSNPTEPEAGESSTQSGSAIEKPAIVINVHSIWTPILAVIMLAVGLLGGYFIRPLIPRVTSGNTAVSTEAVVAQSPAQAQNTPAPQPTMSAADKQKLMDALIKQTRHFKGDANAPVTIIEFSDFQ
jgi:hypothetical protein